MSTKFKRILKWSLATIGCLILLVFIFGYWFIGLIPPSVISKDKLEQTVPADLVYLQENVIALRGKILTVVTSASEMGSTGKSTGYELTELARTYYVFQANGYEVDIASPLGGLPPVVIDEDDMKEFDYAFLNDPIAQEKVKNSFQIGEVSPSDYEAIFFVGGKGAMFDFPNNIHIQTIVREIYERGKVVGAVCHGPAALVNVTLSNGKSILEGKRVSSFTNQEELFLIPDAEDVFPYLLQDKLVEKGAQFDEGTLYLNQVSQDGNLITGQNPWSTWSVAEAIIKQLGHQPKERSISPEEYAASILQVHANNGYDHAKEKLMSYCQSDPNAIDRELIAVHSIVATMQLDIIKAIEILQLLSFSNSFL